MFLTMEELRDFNYTTTILKMKYYLFLLIVWIIGTAVTNAQTSLATFKSEMVLVEGGSMDIQGRLVTLPSYYCSMFEMTQRFFAEVMGFNPVVNPARIHPLKPVELRNTNTSGKWRHYLIFCNELNTRLSLDPVYYKDHKLKIPVTMNDLDSLFDSYADERSNGYRLLISTEWEFAARGGVKTQNYIFSGSNVLSEVGWVSTGGSPKQVGLLKANELGLYDMTGNELELVFDNYAFYPGVNADCGVVWDGGSKIPECRSCSHELGNTNGFCETRKRNQVGSWALGFRLAKNK